MQNEMIYVVDVLQVVAEWIGKPSTLVSFTAVSKPFRRGAAAALQSMLLSSTTSLSTQPSSSRQLQATIASYYNDNSTMPNNEHEATRSSSTGDDGGEDVSTTINRTCCSSHPRQQQQQQWWWAARVVYTVSKFMHSLTTITLDPAESNHRTIAAVVRGADPSTTAAPSSSSDGLFVWRWQPARRLLHLSLAESNTVDDDSIALLARVLPGLETLCLSGCFRITDDGLRRLFMAAAGIDDDDDKTWNAAATPPPPPVRRRWSLQRLDLSGLDQITPKGIAAVATAAAAAAATDDDDDDDGTRNNKSRTGPLPMSSLTRLDLNCCHRMTDAAIPALRPLGNALRKLDLARCHIGDDGTAQIGECLPQLEDLDLSGCRWITDRGLREGLLTVASPSAAAGGGGQEGRRSLRSLTLSGCDRVTGSGLLALPSLSLIHLNLYACTGLRDGPTAAALSALPRLRRLDLYGCRGLTDIVLETIGETHNELRHLDISGCDEMTWTGLAALFAAPATLPALTELDAYGWHGRLTHDRIAAVVPSTIRVRWQALLAPADG